MRMRRLASAVASLALCLPLAAGARPLTYTECVEGSDFIGNAARSRDNGIARSEFIGRLKGDIVAIQAYPAHLRWFVQDADDAEFLIEEAETVFDSNDKPETHAASFFKRCIARMDGRPT
ncbi:MAG: hypothetical protein N2544_16185 [Burkholderiales bacterium]|nr:hypothetical protein [Burkholderiales bacterium]